MPAVVTSPLLDLLVRMLEGWSPLLEGRESGLDACRELEVGERELLEAANAHIRIERFDGRVWLVAMLEDATVMIPLGGRPPPPETFRAAERPAIPAS